MFINFTFAAITSLGVTLMVTAISLLYAVIFAYGIYMRQGVLSLWQFYGTISGALLIVVAGLIGVVFQFYQKILYCINYAAKIATTQ